MWRLSWIIVGKYFRRICNERMATVSTKFIFQPVKIFNDVITLFLHSAFATAVIF
jgi:hypothetical protein